MKKWTSLLLAGILASAFMAGCSKPEEGTPETSDVSKPDGKMEEKKDDAASPGADMKTDTGTEGAGTDTGTGTDGAKTGEGATGDAKTGEGAGETKTEEKTGG